MTQALRELTDFVVGTEVSESDVRERVQLIRQSVLSQSPSIREPNFSKIHPRDIAFVFRSYDEHCFDGRLQRALDRTPLNFSVSTRMTRAGGRTSCYKSVNGEVSYEISVAIGLLFNGFREADRVATVGGLECLDRLQAMQRILEHEIIHLVEYVCWRESRCSQIRFQDMARRHFQHQSHTHQLVTWRERARETGIVTGAKVHFDFEGRRLSGRVNRVTKRATVLVPNPSGRLFSDGQRYNVYYVPLHQLQKTV